MGALFLGFHSLGRIGSAEKGGIRNAREGV